MICVGGPFHGQNYEMQDPLAQEVLLVVPAQMPEYVEAGLKLKEIGPDRQARYVRTSYSHPAKPILVVWQYADTPQKEIWPQFFELFPQYGIPNENISRPN